MISIVQIRFFFGLNSYPLGESSGTAASNVLREMIDRSAGTKDHGLQEPTNAIEQQSKMYSIFICSYRKVMPVHPRPNLVLSSTYGVGGVVILTYRNALLRLIYLFTGKLELIQAALQGTMWHVVSTDVS